MPQVVLSGVGTGGQCEPSPLPEADDVSESCVEAHDERPDARLPGKRRSPVCRSMAELIDT